MARLIRVKKMYKFGSRISDGYKVHLYTTDNPDYALCTEGAEYTTLTKDPVNCSQCLRIAVACKSFRLNKGEKELRDRLDHNSKDPNKSPI
jgi:hypothetical protein